MPENNLCLVDQYGKPINKPEPGAKPVIMVPNTQQIPDDIRRCHKAVRYEPLEQRWGMMLAKLHLRSLLYIAHADRQKLENFQTESLVYLTMSAASLVHGGKFCKIATEIPDEQILVYAQAAPYVQYCCVGEILHRNKIFDDFQPYYDVLDTVRQEVIELSPEGREIGMRMYQDQVERDTKSTQGDGGEKLSPE